MQYRSSNKICRPSWPFTLTRLCAKQRLRLPELGLKNGSTAPRAETDNVERKHMNASYTMVALLGASCVASANMVSLVQVDNTTFGLDPVYPNFDTEDWQTTDLVVHVDPGDDWTSASAYAVTNGGYFQHYAGNDYEPNPGLIVPFPALAFDTFFTNPPTPFFDGNYPVFSAGPIWTVSTVAASWYDTQNTGGGNFTIARFTYKYPFPNPGQATLQIQGFVTYANSGSQQFPFEFTVPAPGSAALLGLSGLLARRRR